MAALVAAIHEVAAAEPETDRQRRTQPIENLLSFPITTGFARIRVDSRDKPGYDDRGSKTRPERGRSIAIAIRAVQFVSEIQKLCYRLSYSPDRGRALSGPAGKVKGDADLQVLGHNRDARPRTESDFFTPIACNPLKSPDSEK
jgi:hypothetical protein